MSGDRLRELENTLLELGTELFRLKSQIGTLTDQNVNLVAVIKSMKSILDEKGLVSNEDFEAAVDLRETNRLLRAANETDEDFQMRHLKKAVH